MSVLLEPIVQFYRNILAPVEPLSSWVGSPLSMLDLGAAFRLCLVLRQIREQLRAVHLQNATSDKVTTAAVEERSFVREASTVLLIVYGGEAITSPYLGIPPSFMYSGVVPLLYIGMQALVEKLPTVHSMSLNSELPLTLFDGMSRAYLLCNLIPPAVLGHQNTALSTSPWTLLLTALVTANAGFFVVNLFSFLQPYALTLSTPPELSPYGWTTTDLWCAPFITGLYATLTHAQPFFSDLHAVLFGWLGAATTDVDGFTKIAPMDPEYARAFCALVLAGLFGIRTLKTFGGLATHPAISQKKVKAQ
ncbi:hypothetical protein BDY19DRAFT_270257 [Irpex rosettiformis]|uniref:Uncharacterized protein n=1 Tax=Irpex rosettiformis TaxID=378272 RepID=A0ACB8UHC0_9APHY|nr:hypothetical protein BDY19DRAFT_270257 [Irpex rosettiformis]